MNADIARNMVKQGSKDRLSHAYHKLLPKYLKKIHKEIQKKAEKGNLFLWYDLVLDAEYSYELVILISDQLKKEGFDIKKFELKDFTVWLWRPVYLLAIGWYKK